MRVGRLQVATVALGWLAVACAGPVGNVGPVEVAPKAPQPEPVDPRLEAVRFLVGTWQTRDTGDLVQETWTAPVADGMLGHGRTVARGTAGVAGKTVEFEFLRITADADGVHYRAQPQGRAETVFALVESGPGLAVFANPQHDFPQRITYRLAGRHLRVRLDGSEGGGTKMIEWVLKRAEAPQ